MEQRFTTVEAQIDALAHSVLARLPQRGLAGGLVEFVVFGLKQGWACLFGGALLFLILVTKLWWPAGLPLARYDFLVLAAVAIQAALIGFKLETWSEARVILIFHLVGTAMELFKTGVGSWSYPEGSVLRIGAVPLFSGFMYAAVGSYMARINRIFDVRLANWPPIWSTALLALLIYVNFFTHHVLPDYRLFLFAAVAVLFGRAIMHYRVLHHWRRMPILLTFLLVALFIWIAENLGTLGGAWIYPSQAAGWSPIGMEKLGSWFLLMIISVVLVTIVHPPRAGGTTTSGLEVSVPSRVARSPPAS